MKEKLRLFYSTCGKIADSQNIAKVLLKNKKVVCVNIIKSVKSYYRESNQIKSCNENVLIIKTFLNQIKLEKILKNNHPYEIPFVIELKTGNVNSEYSRWAGKNK